MSVTLAAAISLNGLLARHDDQRFTSPEDGAWYRQLVAEHEVQVEGRVTFEHIPGGVVDTLLRVVVTSQPAAYAAKAAAGKLEFTAAGPAAILADLRARHYQKILVGGGSTIYAAWLQAGLVDDMFITLEPTLFGAGTPLLTDTLQNCPLDLVDSRPLNAAGTLLLHYRPRR